MTSYSKTFYEPYEVASGRAIGPESDYDEAATEAFLEEAARLQDIDDVAFLTSEACAEAVVATMCAVRFVRAERYSKAAA